MSASVHLGIDVGGTASRWVACSDSGDVLARGKAAGATGHVFNPAERIRLNTALTTIAQDLEAAGYRATTVIAGLTGYGAVVSSDVAALISEGLGVDRASIAIVDDMALAYMATFAPGEGHLVSAGTGSIGLHIGADNAPIRVGGRGILIDDAGSGSWIALRALDHVYRSLDHSGSFDAVANLSRELFATIGSNEWHGVRQFVYGGDRGIIGTLAVAVGRAAAAGDQTALTILRDAGTELAQLGQALIARAGTQPVGFIGGVLDLHPILGEEIQRVLAGHDVRFIKADAALAAARLRRDTRWSRLLLA